MREILFRAKIQGHEGFVFGVPYNTYSDGLFSDKLKTNIFYDSMQYQKEDGSFGIEYIESNTLCQFSGLLDKNGTKIFEGDVIEINHPYDNRYYKGEIIYQDAKFMAKGLYFTHLDNPNDFAECLEYTEVIGSIHDKE